MPLVNLSSSCCFSVIVEEHDTENDKHITKDDIRGLLDLWVDLEFYAFILHDMDRKLDLVVKEYTPKRKHWHIALLFNKKLAKSTILNNFAKSFEINVNCIGVMPLKPMDFTEIGIRYLTHESKGAIADKKPLYDKINVFTSDIERYYFMCKENLNPYLRDVNYYLYLCRKCGSKTELIRIIGAQAYKLDYRVIDVLFKENHGHKILVDKSSGEVIKL